MPGDELLARRSAPPRRGAPAGRARLAKRPPRTGQAAPLAGADKAEADERIGPCRYRETCRTYGDRSVPAWQRTARGYGCEGPGDAHRREHCKTFALSRLCENFERAVAQRRQFTARPGAAEAPAGPSLKGA